MTNAQAYKELVAKVDNLLTWGMYNGFKKVRECNDYEGFYAGATDAAYCFAYGIIDTDYATVQDAIDNLHDDINWYSDSMRFNAYRKGYVVRGKDIVDALRRFESTYIESCNNPIKHVYSLMTLYDFADI